MEEIHIKNTQVVEWYKQFKLHCQCPKQLNCGSSFGQFLAHDLTDDLSSETGKKTEIQKTIACVPRRPGPTHRRKSEKTLNPKLWSTIHHSVGGEILES